MSERDTEFPASTEDSAFADTSRSTAEFRAFANRAGAEAESPWNMRASGRKIVLLAGIILAVAIALAIIAIVVLKA